MGGGWVMKAEGVIKEQSDCREDAIHLPANIPLTHKTAYPTLTSIIEKLLIKN
jgi:hypothetical protein